MSAQPHPTPTLPTEVSRESIDLRHLADGAYVVESIDDVTIHVEREVAGRRVLEATGYRAVTVGRRATREEIERWQRAGLQRQG